MLNLKRNGLKIFDDFQIDFSLPKWIERQKSSTAIQAESNMRNLLIASRLDRNTNNESDSDAWERPQFTPQMRVMADESVFEIELPKPEPAPKKKESSILDVFKRGKKKKKEIEEELIQNFKPISLSEPVFMKKPDAPADNLTVQDFFSSIKNSTTEMELATERTKNYLVGLEYLKKTRQVGLMEKMEAHIEIHRAETQCYALGLIKAITEDQVVEFGKKTERGIKLDWIKNFNRQIPEKVINVKMKADENLIFDNYVIMHYDPDGKSSELTAQDKIKKADPILFGLIFGSTKLYYIGDWTDEWCELTFDKLIEKLGEDAIKANDITAHVLQIKE